MRNKGAIILISVLLTLICLYYLSFTFAVKRVERKADKYAEAQFNSMNLKVDEFEKIRIIDSLTNRYLDSVENLTSFTLFKKYTYMDCKERELNLGLDLKGGMNISLQISAEDIVLALSNNPSDSTLIKAVKLASSTENTQSGKDFIQVFGESYAKVKTPKSPNLAALFISTSNTDKINSKSTDEDVIKYLNDQYEAAIGNAFDVLRKRIDQFGVVQPNIQRDVAVRGIFHIELPGIKDPERVEDLLRAAAVLEFWETYSSEEIISKIDEANEIITKKNKKEEIVVDNTQEETVNTEIIKYDEIILDDDEIITENKVEAKENIDSAKLESSNTASKGSLRERLPERISNSQAYGPVIGFAKKADMQSIMDDLNSEYVKRLFPKDLVFAWSFKPIPNSGGYYQLIVLRKSKSTGGAALGGDVITDANQEFGQNRASAEVSMSMNGAGAQEWARITRENIGKSIAIVLDGHVYSFPNVNDEIKGGRSSITGNFTLEEATDLANVLKSGKMPAPAVIISKEIVGPSLGQKAIDSGLNSFIIAFILVLLYMIFYYNRAGIVANIALVANIFFIFGVLASLGAVLTLPGIAGIVLTLGMAIDANVIIFERIREEVRAGKQIKSAVADGYKNSYSAILDGNITTLIIGIVLAIFGVGPVKGFATTLIIGIISSLFSAIFISRMVFVSLMNHDKKLNFGNKFTHNLFTNLSIKFIKNRKIFYIFSGSMMFISIVLLFTKGLNPGIDFAGGRNYVVAFKETVAPEKVATALEKVYGEAPMVKVFGASNQLKISTKYKINEKNSDNEADSLLYVGIKPLIKEDISMEEFYNDYRQTSQKVGPTVADDIVSKSVIAIVIALLLMFLYILVRFSKWQYSMGATAALIHDALMVLGAFSLFNGILPFNMEVDQAFIAAILTVIGYSINDTVIVFDRIRENLRLFKKRPLDQVMNGAINSTISRTINTSMTTIVVILAIFIFGGEVIRGFTFALLIGVALGTYSSICLASPIAYDLLNRKKENNKETK